MLGCLSSEHYGVAPITHLWYHVQVTLIGETVEIVQTKTSTYVGTIVTEDASNIDENEDSFPCIILEPVNDKRVEVWIPLDSIVSRNVILYGN